MVLSIDGAKIRSTLLQVVADLSARYPDGGLQSSGVLAEAASKLAPPGGRLPADMDSPLLVAFYDLFRTGHLSWGFNLANPNPPFFHVTDQGRRTLAHLSRDPANPDGYLAHLDRQASLNPIARSYVDEALRTYNADCFRAAAVMIGAAAESLILQLRDTVVPGIESLGRTPAKDLRHYLIRPVIEALQKELEMQQTAMSVGLREQFQTAWPVFTYQIRSARNEAGHPASIEPMTQETVHGTFMVFPELASLWAKLMQFAETHYKAKP